MKRRRIFFVAAVLFCASTAIAFSLDDEESNSEWHNEWAKPSEHLLKRTRRSTKDGVGTCMIWTGAHLKSFDGRVASFNSECPHTLMHEQNDLFSIAYEPPVHCKHLQCSLKLHISIGKVRYELSNSGNGVIQVTKDKEPVRSMTEIQLDLLLSFIGPSAVVRLPKYNLMIKWDKRLNVEINAPATQKGKTVGMCGFWDDNASNDWEDANLVSHNLPSFVKSWVDNAIAGAATCNKTVNTKSPCDDEHYVGSHQLKYCGQMNQLAFNPCFAKFDKQQAFIKACEWDYCAHKEEGSCQTITNFAKECRNQDIKVPTSWRRSNFCPFQCSNGYVHDECGPEVHAQCSTNVTGHTSASTCVEGCYCPPGKVEHNNTCIDEWECTCQLNGQEYKQNQQALHRCYLCTCVNGKWECPDMSCFTHGTVWGDPHFKTFDNKIYHFMGRHNYYLLKTSNLSIEGQNFQCGNTVTCMILMKIRYDGIIVDLNQELGININGVPVGLHRLPITIGKIRVKQATAHMLMVELTDIKILIQWIRYYTTNIYIPDNFNEAKGLLGTSNGNANDDFLTPKGDVEPNDAIFGESWRVIDESVQLEPGELESEIPAFVDQCLIDSTKQAEAEKRCSILKTDIFNKCESIVESKLHYESCILDFCNSEDTKQFFCSALNAYATQCAHNNVILEWRNEVPECAIECPLGQTNQQCGDSCTRSCRDINLNGRCDSICVEGCNCPRGMTLDKNGDCIPVTDCPCVYQGVEYPAGTKNLKGNGPQTEICECGSGEWKCSRATIWDRRNSTSFPSTSALCDELQGMVYTECKPDQPKTCQDATTEINPVQTIFCNPGCACKDGHIFDTISRTCVEENSCPCHHSDKSYNTGDVIEQECISCTCNKGHWNCEESECLGTCKIYGASHFETFDRRSFDFNGLCSYLLVQSQTSSVESFKISFTNNICGPEGVPCSRSVQISVGAGDSLESVVLSKSVTALSTKRISVRENGNFIIIEVADLKLSVRWDQINEVTITLNQQWKGLVSGMCGNFNGKDGDDFKTPTSGDLVETSAKVFGDSWKLDPQCTDNMEPKDNCAEHPERKEWATEKCKVLHTAFQECHRVVPVETHYKMCVEDSCGCESGDDCHCLCSAVASYAQKCNENNIPIKWRTQETCPMQCDKQGTFYSPCVSSCAMETCDNSLKTHALKTQLCQQHVCIEGCGQYECPDDHVYKSQEDPICIPKSECKPVCMTVGNITYHEGEMMEYDDCHSCFCTRHQRKCIGKPCQEPTPPPPPPCPEGYTWRDCLYNCSALCHSMRQPLIAEDLCTGSTQCSPGCGKDGLDCARDGLKWRSADQCVDASDCTCASTSGSIVKPNSLFEESACEKCECHGNEYKCEDTCSVEEVTTLSPTSPSPSDCLVCPNVSMSGCTTCNAGLFWNGTTCVARDECPCVMDDLKYAVGSRFLLKDCSDCICRKGGVPQCQAFACQHCENPEYQNEHTSDCNCICKPCPQGFRICTTSRICIREEKWCDGIEDCDEDEKDCIEPPPPDCPPVPKCDAGWMAKKIEIVGEDCPEYKCSEVPKNLICSIDGRQLSSFDGTRLEVDLCNHVIIQHQGLWSVSAVKDCAAKDASCDFYVKVTILGNEIQINQDFSVNYNGQRYSRNQVESVMRNNNFFGIALIGNTMSFTWLDHSITLSISSDSNMRIEIPSIIAGPFRGLCGTPNGDPTDDLMQPDGKLAENPSDFITSWKNPNSVVNCTPLTCSKDQQELSLNICTNIPKAILDLNDCNLNLNQTIQSCIQKTCQCLQTKQAQECRCNAATDFVSTCLVQKRTDLDFSNWRFEANCPAECPANEVFHDCFQHKCERSCSNLRKTCSVGNICHSGCFCKDGYVRKGDSCVLPSQCDDCICEGYSGEQLLSYDGQKVLMNNEGSYLVSGAGGEDGRLLFDIFVTKCRCDDQPGSACTQSVTVKHQGNTINMRWTKEKIVTTINGVRFNEFPVNLQWVEVESNTNWQVALILLELNVKVTFRHTSRTFTITAPSHTLHGKIMEGLCGKCMKDATDVNSIDNNHWHYPNITMGMDGEVCEPVEINNCPPDASTRNSCNAINDVKIFGECHDVVDPAPFTQTCLEQACRDPNAVCRIAQSYADKCRNFGRCLDWRSKSFCPNHECPPSFEYQSCGSGCGQTCASNKKACKFPKIEGCFCPSGRVLRGDICVPEEECKACDDAGHYIGSTWNPSKCETCTCENIGDKPVMKCDKVQCNQLVCAVGEELITAPVQEDECCPKQACSALLECEAQQTPTCQQDQELHQTNFKNCTDFVCSCVPKDKCQPIKITDDEELEEGMERTIDNSGCCPREKLVCNNDICKRPDCAPLDTEIVQGTEKNCCPTHRCVPPKNKCVYYPKYMAGQSVLLPQESVTPQIYDLWATWSDGLCLSCRCNTYVNRLPEAVCSKNCQGVSDASIYVYKEETEQDACCPFFTRTACKDDGDIHPIGSTWKAKNDECTEYECLLENGIVERKIVNPCVTNCGIGQEFVGPGATDCCGKCVDSKCVHEGVLRAIGAVWKSSNGCTTFTCKRNALGRAEVTASTTLCPEANCPVDQQQASTDGCCMICHPLNECEAIVSSANTVGVFSVIDAQFGLCKNTLPVEDFTECLGKCETKTRYIDGKDISDCNCCRVDSLKEISVSLTCATNELITKTFHIPKTCKCAGCGNITL